MLKNNNISIIDYKVGNLLSIKRGLEICGARATVTNDSKKILSSSSVVLPGVGAFKRAMNLIKEYNLEDIIYRTIEKKIPLLGICLGMQLLFEKSNEFGEEKGLGIIKGTVKKLPEAKDKSLKIPSIGWNQLNIKKESTLFKNIKEKSSVYFVHSYMAVPEEKSIITSSYNFGEQDVTASINKENIFGCQFHPEKSGEVGLNIIKNFVNLKL